tara:strand:- start:63 stop:329 length:267 start_codon:yes stop_codon:yes gene_type:complete
MKMMNLFCIKRTDEIDYDEFAGFVIAAETEERAREIAAERAFGIGAEGKEIWLNTFDGNYYTPISQIEMLASDVSLPEGVVLADYMAG